MKWFQVNQIPTLFVLNKKGQLISTNAREEVTEKGTKIFDLWEKAEITPEDIWYEKYFGKTLTNARGEKVATDILRGKIVGIYHSASWCGPCRNFTPELVKFHNAQKKLHNNFEIVLLCEDETKEAMQAYMKEDKMAWLAMPFDKASIQKAWAKIADVAKVDWGIPSLIIFGPDGRLISTSGRKEVIEQGDNIFKVWSAKAKEESK